MPADALRRTHADGQRFAEAVEDQAGNQAAERTLDFARPYRKDITSFVQHFRRRLEPQIGAAHLGHSAEQRDQPLAAGTARCHVPFHPAARLRSSHFTGQVGGVGR